MHRHNKERYPADSLINLLSHTKLTRKIGNRLFPPFMRRSNFEESIYGDYGNAFHWIFASDRIDNDFLAMKRQRYLTEPDEIISLFRSHNINLSEKSVLDVSGGPGSFAHLIKNSVRDIAVTEYSEKMVEAMQPNLSDIRVFCADLNDNWTDAQVFDVVLYRSCAYFCTNLNAHIAQIEPWITPGGYIYINTNMPTLGNALRWQYEDYTHNVFYHPDTLKDILQKNHFSIVASGVSSFYSHFLKWQTFREAVYLLWGIWNILYLKGPHGLDARSSWVLARKNPKEPGERIPLATL